MGNFLDLDQFTNIANLLEKIEDSACIPADLQLYILRLDKLFAQEEKYSPLAGNKWYKLKYNLLEAKKLNHNQILTFGGAYSNHIYAVAEAGKKFDFQTIGVIRGEETLPLNTTLHAAHEAGMQLHYVDRETYKNKKDIKFTENLHEQFGSFYLIPEGGSNALAVQGAKEILQDLPLNFDYACLPVGTGGTLAGVVASLHANQKAVGFAALKNADFLYNEVQHLLEDYQALTQTYIANKSFEIQLDYHFGGYAKTTSTLLDFIQAFSSQHHIPLEPIYTGKMLYGVFDLIKKHYFKAGSTILVIHTGGLR